MPPVQAAMVEFAALRPMPMKSMPESVLPGLNPYQPNHRNNPPQTAIVKSCGSMGAPPSRLNLRPRRGPSTVAAAASDTMPPIVCTTVNVGEVVEVGAETQEGSA